MPPPYQTDVERASEAETRYLATGDLAALAAAAAAWERVLEDAGFAATPESFQLAVANNAAIVFTRQYWALGSLSDLDRALSLWQATLARAMADAPDRSIYLSNLGSGLRTRYARTGIPSDLDAAIVAYEDAVHHTPTDSPDRPGYLNNLGNGLRDRYMQVGDPADLDAAIAAWDNAIRSTPTDSPEQAAILNNLGNGLSDRYERTGDPADLDAAIAAWQDAVRRAPANAPALPSRLSNLGTGLSDRYTRTGDPADLDAAIAAWQDAVRHAPFDAPDRATYLNNLGSGLRTRYARTGIPSDLDAAISIWEDAVQRAPSNAPDRSNYLNSLGNGLSDRFARTGNLADLDAAIAAYEDAVRRTPTDSPNRAARLNNLGSGLGDRYARTGHRADLDAAVAAYEEAVWRTPANAPDRATTLSNLGSGLSDRYARTGDVADLDAAAAHCRAACLAAEATTGEVALRAAQAWAGLALRRGQWAAAQDAAARGRATLQRLNAVNLLAQERASWLKEAQGLAAAEAYAHAQLGDPRAAVLALETGQAQTLNAALGRGRDRALLARLSAGDPSLFAAYEAAADAVRAAQRLGAAEATLTDDAPGAQPAADEVRRRVAAAQAALDAVIARVRARPGYEDLFAPIAFDDVAAAGGATPLAYLATTPAGSLILLLHDAGAGAVESLWAELTSDELDRLLVRRAVAAGNVGEIEGGLLPAQVTGVRLGAELAAALPALGARLMAPLAARLRELGATAVSLIPGGRLNLLPLHAATYPQDGAPRAFLDEFAVAFAPSAEVAGGGQGGTLPRPMREGWGEGPLPRPLGEGWGEGSLPRPLGEGWGEGSLPRPLGEGWGEGSSALIVGNPLPLPPGAPSLRFALEEAATVAGLYREQAAFAGRVAFLPEAAATLEAVSAALPGRAVLHFACHGTFDPDAALDSGLLLADGALLTLRQVRDTAALAGARLVVLSACQTGLTDFRELPDEVIGLPAGFLAAGAAGVAGSLWPVDDRSTALLMGDFHRRVLAGEGAAEALRAAQRWLRGVTRAELGAYYEAHIRRMSAAEAFAAQGAVLGGGPPDEAPFAAPTHWAAFTFNGALR